MLSLDKLISLTNFSYYNKKVPTIYCDFSTYAQSKNNVLGKANALNFLSKFQKSEKEELNILELGCGNGSFALSFLNFLKNKNKKLLENINYFLADFSPPVLNLAFKNIKKSFPNLNLKKILFDANSPNFKFEERFDYIRANELLSDLGAKVYVKKPPFFYEVKYDYNLNFSLTKLKPSSSVLSILNYFPENFFIPFNFKAAKLLFYLYGFLNRGGYAEFFDYGFFSREDFILEEEEWNKLIVRKYSNQITVDVNFFYLQNFLKSKSIFPQLKLQRKYIEDVVGKKPFRVETTEGLDYVFRNSAIEEEDYFYFLGFSK
ncbi:MAG: SAM-dependent methyltransferase [Candidatus Anstonellaceae archaeon]